jgi:hypothetical protein
VVVEVLDEAEVLLDPDVLAARAWGRICGSEGGSCGMILELVE